LGILVISLGAAHELSVSTPTAPRRITFGEDILPNHVLYPLVMIGDRVRLWQAHTPEERVQLQVEYAHRRLAYAQTLFAQGQIELAVTTITKAEKYLQHASNQIVAQRLSPALTQYVLRSIEHHHQTIRPYMFQLTNNDRAVLDKLIAENTSIMSSLTTLLAGK
jgi:hypothetical protein